MSTLRPRRRATPLLAIGIAAPLAAALAWLTLTPTRIEQRIPEAIRDARAWITETFGAQWADPAFLDFSANVFVFFVVGLVAFLVFPRRWWPVAALSGPVLSAGIEYAQLVFLPNRVPSLLDIVAASIGSVAAVAVGGICTWAFARERTVVHPVSAQTASA